MSVLRATGQNLPADQAERDRIVSELGTTMLVEASAGSGKTTMLVNRLVALVESGVPFERIAVVTFTRKAAAELRQRTQETLEDSLRKSREAGNTKRVRLLENALPGMDLGFIGTIHAFCGRLLRESALDAGVDPGFQEISEDEWRTFVAEFWNDWLRRARRDDDPDLVALRKVRLDPRQLGDAFEIVVQYPDVEFAVEAREAPDVSKCRETLVALLKRAGKVLPTSDAPTDRDDLESLVRELQFKRRTLRWDDVAQFCEAIADLPGKTPRPTLKRWRGDKDERKAVIEHLDDFITGEGARVLKSWREHRYPAAMKVLLRAARDFAAWRRAIGRLGFEDLLQLTAKLLRDSPRARARLGERFQRLLVDEFQDTDPIQAEVCFLLASSEGTDWRTVRPRDGALFLVGDPKQSIYRFRRADLQTYEMVKQRITECGTVIRLTQNFRSNDAIRDFVNAHFSRVLPATDDGVQAPFSEMSTNKPVPEDGGVARYAARPRGLKDDDLFEDDAPKVASWIADLIQRGKAAPGDFLVITPKKKAIAKYGRALAERNIPVEVSGAPHLQEYELTETIILLEALADPQNELRVVAALMGLFVGCSPDDLLDARRRSQRFILNEPPADVTTRVGAGLAHLHRWHELSLSGPIDVLIDAILTESGLTAYAASQPMGDARAGVLLHLAESLRSRDAAGGRGASTLRDAVELLKTMLDADAADVSLRPGRKGVVRVMNLHKAKGLEARFVVLAAPLQPWREFKPVEHVERGAETPRAWLRVIHEQGNTTRVLAQPPGWDELERRETVMQAAERNRLLYVATTRARELLLVSANEREDAQGELAPDQSEWSPLAPTLAEHARTIPINVQRPRGRSRLQLSADQMLARVGASADLVAAAATVTATRTSVSRAAAEKSHQDREELSRETRAGDFGRAWGHAVHRTLEAAGRGRRGDDLDDFIAAVTRDEALTASGEEREAVALRLKATVERVLAGDAWKTLAAGDAAFELPVVRVEQEGEVVRVTEGVIDAAVRTAGGWRVLDWKTDRADDVTWAERAPRYEDQVAQYAAMLMALTGDEAEGRIVRVAPAD